MSKNPGWYQPNGNGSHNYGGSGKPMKGRSAGKSSNSGCAVTALAMLGGLGAIAAALVAGAVELARAIA